MPEDITLLDALYSQRAIRYFTDEPVPDETVHRLIEAATKAPSGGNRQGWKFLRNPRPGRQEHHRRLLRKVLGACLRLREPESARHSEPRPAGPADHLARHMADVPVLIMACIEHDGEPSSMGRGGSIFPAVQNLLLAAQGLGLGSCLTSLHKRYEEEIKELLGIPENVRDRRPAAIGFPASNARYGPTTRAPVEEVTFRERWEQAW